MPTRIAALTLLTTLALAAPQTPLPWRGKPMPTLTGLMFNQDCTDFFYSNAITKDVDAGALMDEYFGVLADAGVTTLLINTNARKVNYTSDVWETFWGGYDPDGPDDQPFFTGVAEADRPGWRRMIHSMMEVDRQGIDYPARIIDLCRRRGVSPWITLRMNDVHCNDDLRHPFHGALWRDERFFRGGGGYYGRGLDYAHAEVRNMYKALILESLQRYDMDGLELDFMREPYLFEPGAEAEGAKVLHDWLRMVRRLVYDESVRRGHPIYLAVRVPSRIEVAQSWGLEAIRWAHEGLVDLVVATPRWATLEYDMPLDQWKEALASTGVTLAGGLEILHRPMPGGNPDSLTGEQATGAATAALHAGADVVYLFNYFTPLRFNPTWTPEGYNRIFTAMHSLDALCALPRRHAITWRDITGVGEAYTPPLPATGAALTFTLPTGPKPSAVATVTLDLRFSQPADPPAATINGVAAQCVSSRADGPEAAIATYAVPASALQGTRHEAVALTAPAPITVYALEIAIAPPKWP